MTDAPVVFSAHALCKVYRSGEVEVHALRDVEMEIRRGEFVVLLGASGSGKPTLLNILGGLDLPSSGEVHFGDTTLTGASERDLTTYRREHVGFVFQFYNLIPSLTVRENLALVTDIAKNPMPVDEAIERVGLNPGAITSRRNSRAVNNSAWPLRGPLSNALTCCCATSPPVRSITSLASWCWK